jgi:dTDP-4-dehydrorhamnose 3,5-epimerase
MKIISVTGLSIPEIKVVRFARFCDHRGYFTETFRKSDIIHNPELSSLRDAAFVQGNQSFSKKGVMRGLHFQWNPYMGKLVRTIEGHMMDLVLDIRKGSKAFGKIIAYDMPAVQGNDSDEWIWIPPGFAHGNFFLADTIIEYLCTGEYSQGCEAGISPIAGDIDWSLCDAGLKHLFDEASKTAVMSDKDKNGLTVTAWSGDKRSGNFIFEELKMEGLS